MTEEYDPHIVVHRILETWYVTEHPNEDHAREEFERLYDRVDVIILARRIRKHVGPEEQTISEDGVGTTA